MMSVQLNAEYPEHLNPFHTRRSSLRQSFRGLKKAIVRSFTGKDKEKPMLRPKPALPEQTLVVPSVQRSHLEPPPIAFPRSRFSERISKTETLQKPTENTRKSLPNAIGHNPFDDENKLNRNLPQNDNPASPPKPAQRTKLKRRKKRAPIPPDSNLNGHLSTSEDGSKWSLVSTESEMSSMCYSEYDGELTDINSDQTKAEEILKITQEIAKFAEDTNNNNILSDTQPRMSNEVDSVDKSTNDNVMYKNTVDNHQSFDHSTLEKHTHVVNVDEKTSEVVQESVRDGNEVNEATPPSRKHEKEICDVIEATPSPKDEKEVGDVTEAIPPSPQDEKEVGDVTEAIPPSPKDKKEIGDVTEAIPLSPKDEKEINDVNEAIPPSPKDEKETNDVTEDTPLSPKRETEKDDVTKVSPPSPKHEKEVEYNTDDKVIRRTASVRHTIEYFEAARPNSSPTPKFRKNIYTKETLLGSE